MSIEKEIINIINKINVYKKNQINKNDKFVDVLICQNEQEKNNYVNAVNLINHLEDYNYYILNITLIDTAVYMIMLYER